MDLFTLAFTAFIVGLSGAMMPGPMFTVTINEVSRRGFWAGPLIVAGHAFIEFVLVIGLILGLSQFVRHPSVLGIIGLCGGAMLIRMAWGIGRDAALKRVSLTLSPDKDRAPATVLPSGLAPPGFAGILTSVGNPYWLLWWATVGAGYLVMAVDIGTMGIIAFFIGHILSDLAWFSLIAFVVNSGRNVISPSVYRAVLLICSLFLGYLGIYFMYDGLLKFIL